MTSIDPFARFGEVPQFSLTSSVMTHGGPLAAAQYGIGAGGANVSPDLAWSGFPAETQSFALTVYDPDAPTGSGYWHWAVFNIPAHVDSLPTGAGVENSPLLPAGSAVMPNDAREPTFVGAGPPPGTGTHRYQFVVHALDVPSLDVDLDASSAVLGFNVHFHTLARGVLEATGVAGGAEAAA
ncbi:MAG: YbhB/YbcL family Raf kinase inhibitor-like protein [Cryobacterium sp.]